MITTLFYLVLAIILIGLAIYIYNYLSQQQSKFIRKNNYDVALDEVKPKRLGSFASRVIIPNQLFISIGFGILFCTTLYFLSITYSTQFFTYLHSLSWLEFVYVSIIFIIATPLGPAIALTAVIFGFLVFKMMKTMR